MTETKIHSLPNGWHLVEHGTWSISVGPDAVIRLPLHVTPAEVPDFIAAMHAAAEHATNVKTMNETRVADNQPGPRHPIMVTPSSEIPDGYTKLGAKPRNQPVRGSIGRRGSARTSKPPVPRQSAPPMPPPRGQ